MPSTEGARAEALRQIKSDVERSATHDDPAGRAEYEIAEKGALCDAALPAALGVYPLRDQQIASDAQRRVPDEGVEALERQKCVHVTEAQTVVHDCGSGGLNVASSPGRYG